MPSLAEIRNAKGEAASLFAESLQALCRLIPNTPNNLQAIAATQSYHRELEALNKIELEILSNGKTSPITA